MNIKDFILGYLIGKNDASGGGGGGASNIITGDFTTGSTEGTEETVTIPYSGNGYPVAALVYVDGGLKGNAAFAAAVKSGAYATFALVKAVVSTAPTYSGSGDENLGTIVGERKGSSSDPTTYAAGGVPSDPLYSTTTVIGAYNVPAVFRSNTQLAYKISDGTSSNRSLLASTKYNYIVIYSE